MPHGITIVRRMIAGGEAAFNNFYALSGGLWLNHAPEYILNSAAIFGLVETKAITAGFEVNRYKTLVAAGAVKRGPRPKDVRLNGKFDAVIYRRDGGTPRCVIEAKTDIWNLGNAQFNLDFASLIYAVTAKNGGTIDFSAFLFYANVDNPKNGNYCNAADRLKKLIEGIKQRAETAVSNDSLLAHMQHGNIFETDNLGAWCVGCVVFLPKSKERDFG